jgi:hypothetical protein
MSIETESTPAERAAEYLERIAWLTGAKLHDDGTYHLTVGHVRFRVDYKFVISHCGKSTCFETGCCASMSTWICCGLPRYPARGIDRNCATTTEEQSTTI